MSIEGRYGNPGDPRNVSQGSEYAGQLIIKGERQTQSGKSDGRVVPVKAGNSAGGKAATQVTAK